MPNWCYTNITFESDNKEFLDKLLEDIQETKTFLNILRPRPAELENWYEWCCDNWGTKWDLCEEEFSNISKWGDKKIQMGVQFAWCPPEEALQYFHSQHPDVKVEWLYVEEGMDFCGHKILEGGDNVFDDYYDSMSSKSKEEWRQDDSELGGFVCAMMESYWECQDESEDESEDQTILPESVDVGGLDILDQQ